MERRKSTKKQFTGRNPRIDCVPTQSSGGSCLENGSMPYNPNDPTIWYNEPEVKAKVEKIIKKFGKPFLITKGGELLYEDSVVIPAFRQGDNND